MTDMIIQFENGELTQEETIELFRELVRTGLAWILQGSYGRIASEFIKTGVI